MTHQEVAAEVLYYYINGTLAMAALSLSGLCVYGWYRLFKWALGTKRR